MPTYDFECEKGHMTTVVCRIADRELPVECATCKGETHRVFSLATVHTLEEYADAELADDGSSQPFVVTSKRQKERRMRELGLECVPMSDRARDRKRSGAIFSIPKG